MVRSLDSSISSLNASKIGYCPADTQARPAPEVGITVTEPSLVLNRRHSMSDTDSIVSRNSFPLQDSAAELSATSSTPECRCICPVTGTPLGPPCRMCRAASYNIMQEEQARRVRMRARLQSVTATLSSRMSVLSNACNWVRKRKRRFNPDEGASRQQSSHRKKDSVVSWPDSECTYFSDELIEDAAPHKNEESVASINEPSHKVPSYSGNGLLRRKGARKRGFLRIPDTDEEKSARKEEKRRRIAESYRPETGSVDYWHNEYGMLDWRIVWAMSAIC